MASTFGAGFEFSKNRALALEARPGDAHGDATLHNVYYRSDVLINGAPLERLPWTDSTGTYGAMAFLTRWSADDQFTAFMNAST